MFSPGHDQTQGAARVVHSVFKTLLHSPSAGCAPHIGYVHFYQLQMSLDLKQPTCISELPNVRQRQTMWGE